MRRQVFLGVALGVWLCGCGGRMPTAPGRAQLEVAGLTAAISGQPGNYIYGIDLRVQNAGTEPAIVTSMDVTITAGGTSLAAFTFKPATSPIPGGQAATFQAFTVTPAPGTARGDTLRLTVTYTDVGGVQQVTGSTPLGG
jgi:hypothetical protein